jgi:hypothetical protein
MGSTNLTPLRILCAISIGLAIAFAVMFVTAPHPVVVPTQTITPVPTPPPVIITQAPVVTETPNEPTSEAIDPDLVGWVNMCSIILVFTGFAIALYFLKMVDEFYYDN